ncbi:serine acetyltransferase [Rhodoferax lacus]|uniref:Serine acetyltransferase n=1 Tax=Rhodoferax lacus TaxID=2184758 RepID=A0A3E1RF51_9BURK|nr:serine acetyltransferase [Rhodoferax lacus]RFO97999.1 serine acetyltransferase [Rhodoferax lacus]
MTTEVSATEPDWSREAKPFWAWHPAKSLLTCIRDYQRAASRPGVFALVCKHYAKFRHIFWAAITGADIPIACKIGGGLLIPHPNGIVIHPDAVIGPNCLIFQQVTIGGGNSGVPTVGGHVDIGAGAKVLGGIKLGSHAKIGANAVVIMDVPENCTAVGVPAKLMFRDH